MSASHTSKIRFHITFLFTLPSSGWFPSLRFPYPNPVCLSPLLHACYMPRPSQSPLFISLMIFGKKYRASVFSLYCLSHPPNTSSFLGQNILLSSLFSKTLGLLSSLYARDQDSHLFKTQPKYSSVWRRGIP